MLLNQTISTGDYDGDKVLAMWDPEVVSHFQNAPDKFSVEPQGLDLSFTRDTERGEGFLMRLSALSEAEKAPALQQYLLGGLISPFLVGKYSTWHSNAIYRLGYAHPRTRKLASKCVPSFLNIFLLEADLHSLQIRKGNGCREKWLPYQA